MSAEYPGALWLPMQHSGFAVPFTPRYVILHATAGDATPQAVQTTCDQRGTSVHFSIGEDGTVAQHVPLDTAAYGNGVVTAGADAWWYHSPAGNPNNETISIEHCKMDTTNQAGLSLAQAQASFALVRWLCDRFSIPARGADPQGGITGHYSIDPVNRARCPGTYPWQDLWTALNGGHPMWTRQGDQGVDSLGHTCGGGFIAEIEAKGITANGLANELYAASLGVTLPGVASFLALANGDTLVWDGANVSHNGALVVVGLYNALTTIEHQPQADAADAQKLAQIKQIVEG